MPMDEYLKPRLFEPLGITDYLWEKCPRGITERRLGTFHAYRGYGEAWTAISE